MSSVRTNLLDLVGTTLDGMGVTNVSVDVPVVTDNMVTVYITTPSGVRDEIDELSIYNAISADPTFDDISVEIEIIDSSEESDALEGAFGTSESEDDEEEEDLLAADNLTLLDDDGGRELHMRSRSVGTEYEPEEDEYDDEDEEEDDSEFESDDDIESIDEYEPSWDDLEEIMKERSDDYY